MWTICTDVKLLSVCFVLLFLGQHEFRTMYAEGTGVTLVPVPTKTARCHSDIKGRRPFDVPANNVYFNFRYGKRLNPRTSMSSI